jgi:hypothetical protein
VTTNPETPFPDVTVHTFGVDPQDSGNPEKGADVVIKERGCELILRFAGRTGDAPLVELRLRPDCGKHLDPAKARHLFPQLNLYLAVARASMSWDFGDARAAAEALRQIGRPGRGLSDDFFRVVAVQYKALVAEGERYPVKALAAMQPGKTNISTASRWIKEAKRRGFIETEEAEHAR